MDMDLLLQYLYSQANTDIVGDCSRALPLRDQCDARLRLVESLSTRYNFTPKFYNIKTNPGLSSRVRFRLAMQPETDMEKPVVISTDYSLRT